MALATSTDHGNNLQTVQLLIKKNQVMCLLLFTNRANLEQFNTHLLKTPCSTDITEGDPGPSASL